MPVLTTSDDKKTIALGNLRPMRVLNAIESFNLSAMASSPPPTQAQAILDSCGCSGSITVPIPTSNNQSAPTLTSQLFKYDWSKGWGMSSASAAYVVAENLTPPEQYCCDAEIPTFSGGSICEQSTNIVTFAQKVSTCLLHQKDHCGPNGWEPALSQESLESMMVIESMKAYINHLAINGLPSAGIQGMRNTPGIQTYNIKKYATLTPEKMNSALSGVWPLMVPSGSSMMFNSGSVGDDWVIVGGTKIINYLRNMLLPNGNSVLGTFTGSCQGMCTDLGAIVRPNQIINDSLLDSPTEIYLIRRQAATIVANLFDADGQLSESGSVIHTCIPRDSCADPFTATKTLFFRFGGLLLHSQNAIIRIRFN